MTLELHPFSRSIARRVAAQPRFSENTASSDSPFNELSNVINCFVSVQSRDIFDLLEDLRGYIDIATIFSIFSGSLGRLPVTPIGGD